MVYVLSVSLQLSAGIVLLIWSFKSFQNNVLNLYFPGSNAVAPDQDNNVVLDKDRLRNKANTIIMSLLSFVDLSLGFVLSIFAEKEYENIVNLVLVVIISVCIVLLDAGLSFQLSRIKFKSDIEIPYAKLEEKGIDTLVPLSESDIDAILNS